MPVFDKKTVYHSQLRAVTESDGIWITLTGEVRDSKYAGKPAYVTFKVDAGDGLGVEGDYTYTIENDTVRAQLEGLKVNTFYWVKAHGTKESAYLEIETESGNKLAVPEGAERSKGGTPPPSGRGARGGGSGGRQGAAFRQERAEPQQQAAPPSLARVVWECLKAAHDLEEAYEKTYGQPMSENARAIAISLSIEHHKGNRAPIADPRK